MEYRTLGKTGLQVSALGIGTWQISGAVAFDGRADGHPDPGAAAAVRLIRECGDLGLNLLDTAPMYGLGEGERRAGAAIRGRRAQWIVSTKFGAMPTEDGGRRTDLAAIRPQLEASLQRLGTDYVDLYLYHCPPDPELIDAVRAELEQLKREGKLRFHGISTKDATAIRSLTAKSAADVVMIAQSLLTHPAASLRLAERHRLGVLARGALEWGRLSGRYFDRPAEFGRDDIRGVTFAGDDLTRYAGFAELVPPGATMAMTALRYVLDFATTHCLVLGGKTVQQYREAVGALSMPPLDAESARLAAHLRSRLNGRGAWRRAMRAARNLLPTR